MIGLVFTSIKKQSCGDGAGRTGEGIAGHCNAQDRMPARIMFVIHFFDSLRECGILVD
jgi:hypothetical protein